MNGPHATGGGTEDRPRAAEAWRAVVDARLVDCCERHERRAARMRRQPSLPSYVRAPRLHLDPADWGAGFLRLRERELPMELQSDLRQLMPQALLRDLYRPVPEVGWVERAVIAGTGDRGGFGAMQAARAARTRAPLPRLESAMKTVRAYQTWRRHLMAERWQPILGDDEPRRPVAI